MLNKVRRRNPYLFTPSEFDVDDIFTNELTVSTTLRILPILEFVECIQ